MCKCASHLEGKAYIFFSIATSMNGYLL
ncbi:hypothetical protein [Wolbachia endosymbiont of Litomosoides brasiliensis]